MRAPATTVVLVEGGGGRLDADALGVLGAAARLSGETVALLCGSGVRALVGEAARHGATRIFVADDPALADPLAALRADLAAEAIRRLGDVLFLCATNAVTTDMAGILAARLEAGLVWGLTGIENRDGVPVGSRLTQGDAVFAEIEWSTAVGIGLFRPHCLEPVAVTAAADVPVEVLEVPSAAAGAPVLVALSPLTAGAGPSLATAEVVVSGGRGLEAPENLALVRDLAAALGGVAGVSLPLVEMGWAPRSMQVGQTGTVVRPRLYVACGISGQIQHRVGIENSGTIVAINKDRGAPIMNFCDLAVVGEVQSVVPRLIALLKRRSGGDPSEPRPA